MASIAGRKITIQNNQQHRHIGKGRDESFPAQKPAAEPLGTAAVKSKSASIMGTVNQQLELLNRHFHVLELLVNNRKSLGILKLSKLVGCPAHQIRYSLRELENVGLVVPTTQGAKVGGDLTEFTDTAEADLKRINKQLEELGARINELKKKTGGTVTSSDDFRPGNY